MPDSFSNLEKLRKLLEDHIPENMMERIFEATRQEEIRIGVFGKFKTGKSSVLNSLLGQKDFLVVAEQPSTSTIVEIRRGNRLAYFRIRDKEVCEVNRNQFIDKTGNAVGAKVNPEREHWRLEVVCNWLKPGVTLVDSPGIDEDPQRSIISRNEMSHCDAAIIVIDQQQIGNLKEKELIEELDLPAERRIIVLNFVDKIDHNNNETLEQNIKKKLSFIKKRLPGTFEDNLIAYSAKEALAQGQSYKPLVILRNMIAKQLAKSPKQARFIRVQKELHSVLSKIQKKFSSKIQTMEVDLARIKNELERIETNVIGIQNAQKQLESQIFEIKNYHEKKFENKVKDLWDEKVNELLSLCLNCNLGVTASLNDRKKYISAVFSKAEEKFIEIIQKCIKRELEREASSQIMMLPIPIELPEDLKEQLLHALRSQSIPGEKKLMSSIRSILRKIHDQARETLNPQGMLDIIFELFSSNAKIESNLHKIVADKIRDFLLQSNQRSEFAAGVSNSLGGLLKNLNKESAKKCQDLIAPHIRKLQNKKSQYQQEQKKIELEIQRKNTIIDGIKDFLQTLADSNDPEPEKEADKSQKACFTQQEFLNPLPDSNKNSQLLFTDRLLNVTAIPVCLILTFVIINWQTPSYSNLAICFDNSNYVDNVFYLVTFFLIYSNFLIWKDLIRKKSADNP